MQNVLNNFQSLGRDKGIETLRGIAIIFMVAGHVIGTGTRSGLSVSENSWFRYFYYSFEYLRMPLFTVISGFVYAMRPISTSQEQKKFIKRKIVRLILPFLCAVTLLCFFQMITPGTNAKLPLGEFWRAYLSPYAQFWFVQGIFTTFIIISFLEITGLVKNLRGWLVIFLISILLFYADIITTTFFSLDRVPFLLMFFLFGLGLKRFYHILFNNKIIKTIAVILFLVGIISQQVLYFNKNIDEEHFAKIFTVLVGTSGAFVLVITRFYNALLAWIGNFSYEIFLYHPFGTAGGRIFLRSIGISNLNVYFVICLVLGIALPIIFRLVCNKYPVLTTVLFGERRKTKKENLRNATLPMVS